MSKDTKKIEAKNQQPVATTLHDVLDTLSSDVEASTPEARLKMLKARPGFEPIAQQLATDLKQLGVSLPDQDPEVMLEAIAKAQALAPSRELASRIAEKIEDTYQRHRSVAFSIFLANYRLLSLLAETNGNAAQAVKPIEDFFAPASRPKKTEAAGNTDVEVDTPVTTPKISHG